MKPICPNIPPDLSLDDKAAFVAGAAICFAVKAAREDMEKTRERLRVFSAIFPHVPGREWAAIFTALEWGSSDGDHPPADSPHADPVTAAKVYLGRGVLAFLAVPVDGSPEAEEARRLVTGWFVVGCHQSGLAAALQGALGAEIIAAVRGRDLDPLEPREDRGGPRRPGGKFAYRGA